MLGRRNTIRNSGAPEQFIIAIQADVQGRLGLEDRPYPQAKLLRLVLEAASRVETHDPRGQELTDAIIKQKRVEALKILRDDIIMH